MNQKKWEKDINKNYHDLNLKRSLWTYYVYM